MLSRLTAVGLLLIGVVELAWMNASLYPEVWNSRVAPPKKTVLASSGVVAEIKQAGLVGSNGPAVPASTSSTEADAKGADTGLLRPVARAGPDFSQTRVEATLLFSRVGSARPSAKARREIRALVRQLLEEEPKAIEVRGHSDSQGDRSDNLLLSRSRAAAVTQLLVSSGLDPELIFTTGVGASDPADADAHGYGRRVNRRVEIRVLRKIP